jgi:hypothetical protein
MDNTVEDIKLYQKNWLGPPEKNGQRPPVEAGFPVATSGTVGYGKTETTGSQSSPACPPP